MKNEDNTSFCNDPYDDLGFLFWQLMKVWHRGKHRLLDEFGITASQMEILSSIYNMNLAKEEVTQKNIADVTNVDPMTTSTILRNLQKKNLITRHLSETDTRARVVELTDEGRELLMKARKKMENATAKLAHSVDEEILKRELKKILEVLTEFYK